MPIISSMFFFVVLVLETITAWQRKNHILAESKLGKLDNLILIYIVKCTLIDLYFLNLVGASRQGYKNFHMATWTFFVLKRKKIDGLSRKIKCRVSPSSVNVSR
jgi:hypothetical protein